MAEGNVVLCGCPNCQRAVTPTPQAAKAGWYQCTRCGLFYQSHHGCGCALAAAEARERALREALREVIPPEAIIGCNDLLTPKAGWLEWCEHVRTLLAEEGTRGR